MSPGATPLFNINKGHQLEPRTILLENLTQGEAELQIMRDKICTLHVITQPKFRNILKEQWSIEK